MHRLLFLLPLFACPLLPAQGWVEIGDAGGLPATAQFVAGTGPLTILTGNVNSDADLFLIQIDSPGTFSAIVTAGTITDSQLFLFDQTGRGVVHNDDVSGANYLSAITPGTVKTPGRYYLAISSWNHDPVTVLGGIWVGNNTTSQALPDAAGRFERITAWSGSSQYNGTYSIALTGAAKVNRQVVLPDSHHLSESPHQMGASGSTDHFTAGGGRRFQLLYEYNHFVSAGVTGPVTITRLLFRGEEGQPNPTSATWSNAVVRLGRTWISGLNLSNDFSMNTGVSTVLGAPFTTTIAMQPSQGSTPNNDNIVIDLAAMGAAFAYDPTASYPNLLVDITLPGPAVTSGPGAIVPMQDTTGGSGGFAGILCRGVTGAAGANTGVLGSPLVMAVEFTGGTGGEALIVPARNEIYGAACGGAPASFYQTFVNGQSFDLIGLRLLPDSVATPGFYTVTANASPIDLTKVGGAPLSTADEAIVTVMPGFFVNLPGVALNTLRVSTNGFVWADIGSSLQDFTPSVGEFLGSTAASPARLAPCWYDFHCGRNVATHPNSGLHALTEGAAGNRVCYITWKDVGLFDAAPGGGVAAYSMQMVIHEATGAIEFRYGAMPRFCAGTSSLPGDVAGIVGFTRGLIGATPSVDPQSRDLSVEVPFATAPEGSQGNLGLTAVTTPIAAGAAYGGRMFAGQTVKWNASNVPAGTILGVQLLDVAPSRPGFQLPTITAPGCMLSTTANALLWEVDVLPGPGVTGTVGFTVPPGFDGVELHAQYVVLGGLFGAPDLITSASNSLLHTVGRR